mgnify:CR=1 FL=1
MRTLLQMIEAYANACETHGFYDGQLEMDEIRDASDLRFLKKCAKDKQRAKQSLLKFIGFNTGANTP